MKEIVAIYPGTFDPITHGHMDIIKRASKIFERLIIAVADDTPKSPVFSLAERVNIVEQEIKSLLNNNNKKSIKVMPFSGLLVDFARSQKATVIIRGLRAASDFEYEFQMSYMNYKLASEVETLFMPATENGHFISSRFVKELARLKGNLKGFVSDNVARKLYEYYSNS